MARKGLHFADASSRASPEDQLPLPQARSPSSSPVSNSVRQKLRALRKKMTQGQILVPGPEVDGSGKDYSQHSTSSFGVTESDDASLRVPLLSTRLQGCLNDIFGRRGNFITSNRDRMPNSDRQSTSFQDAILPKEWPDEELEIQREVIEKYAAGVRLWTKEKLISMEDMIAGLGDKVHTSVYAGPGNYSVQKEAGLDDRYLYQVDFHGYKALAFPPPSRANGIPYSSMTISMKVPHPFTPAMDLDAQEEIFLRWRAVWDANPLGHHFHASFMRLPFPPYINKIVCIGLGNFIASADADENRDEGSRDRDSLPTAQQQQQHSLLRHAAVVTAAEALYQRFGRPIQILAQDPEYTADCAAVLFRRGFSVVGRYGAAGLAEIDDRTFVFAPAPGFCAKEVVADVARPAGMFWRTVASAEEECERENRSGRVLDFGDRVAGYWNPDIADPDTPRVHLLAKQYDVYPFPYTNLFGDVSIYSHKGLA
ncbi:hypothetical protein F4811DRAFT_556039 [Daldinia bambusicola]|nr:hypothetical protein F4811DRAFT_556039 [Daldinia bambusicola]